VTEAVHLVNSWCVFRNSTLKILEFEVQYFQSGFGAVVTGCACSKQCRRRLRYPSTFVLWPLLTGSHLPHSLLFNVMTF